MVIKSINIISFGMIKNRTFEFADGLNVIEGDNETGKSTVGAFIKFMFYGMNKAEREKYTGWGEPGCSGTLTLESGGDTYRIERELLITRPKDKVAVIAPNGAPIKTDKTPAELFIGLPEQVYLNTSFTGQLGSAVNGAGLPEAVENILFSADEAVNTAKALKKLDDMRITLLYKNKKGGRVLELENTAAELEYKLSSAKSASEQIFTLDDSIRTMRTRYASNKEKAALIMAQLEEYDAYMRLDAAATHEENKKELSKKEQAVKALEEERGKNGFLPDGEYTDRLHTLNAELAELHSEEAENERDLREAAEDIDNDEAGAIVKMASGVGGVEGVRKIYGGIMKKTSSFRITALICVIAAILSFGAGVMFFLQDLIIPHVVICGVCAVVFAVIAVIMFSKISKLMSGLHKLAAKLGAEDCKKIPELLNYAEERSSDTEKKSKRLDAARERQIKLKEKSDTLKAKIIAETSKCGVADPSKLPELIAEAEKTVTDLSAARSELEIAQYKARISAEKIEGVDVTKLREKIKGALPVSEFKNFNVDMKRTELNWLTKQNESLTDKLTEAERSLAAANATFTLPSQIYARLTDTRAALEEAREDYEAYVLAYEKLSEASRELRSSISPMLARYAGDLMNGFSGGKYTELGISDTFGITYSGGGMTHPADTLSSGTQDMAYISLRLSLVRLLYKEKTAVFFDDTFARVDNGRLIRIMKTLSTLDDQCIIFTCRDREGKCAEIFGGKLIKV